MNVNKLKININFTNIQNTNLLNNRIRIYFFLNVFLTKKNEFYLIFNIFSFI